MKDFELKRPLFFGINYQVSHAYIIKKNQASSLTIYNLRIKKKQYR